MCLCAYVCMCACVYVCMCVCVYVYMYVCVYVCMCECICLYVCLVVCVFDVHLTYSACVCDYCLVSCMRASNANAVCAVVVVCLCLMRVHMSCIYFRYVLWNICISLLCHSAALDCLSQACPVEGATHICL